MVRKKAMTDVEFTEWLKSKLNGCNNGCLEWTLGLTNDGYGKVKRNGKTLRTHKWMLEQKLGRPLGEGMVTRHTCNNPTCCNPEHLIEGTPADNVGDKIRCGRNIGPRGEKQGHSKLTTEQVLQIKNYNGTLLQRELAVLYGVNRTCINRIINGVRWNHIILDNM